MKIICDLDGTLFLPEKCAKIVRLVEENKVPWPLTLIGLRIASQKIDPEMLLLLEARYMAGDYIQIASGRPEQSEKYTKKKLKKKKIFFNSVKCLGSLRAKIENIRTEKPDIVIDDNEKIISACKKAGYPAFLPSEFKEEFKRGAIN